MPQPVLLWPSFTVISLKIVDEKRQKSMSLMCIACLLSFSDHQEITVYRFNHSF